MEHLQRNTTIPIPVDIALFSGTTPQTGQATNLTLEVFCLENGYILDLSDGTFKLSPATPTQGMAPYAAFAYDYAVILSQTINWPRGRYRAIINNTSTLQEYTYDFSLGLFVPRELGFSAVYDGTTLSLSVWVEEDGVCQTDYVALNNCKLMDGFGNVLAGGDWGNNAITTDGIFSFEKQVSLTPTSNYIFKCDALVAAPATRPNYSFNLRLGIARP